MYGRKITRRNEIPVALGQTQPDKLHVWGQFWPVGQHWIIRLSAEHAAMKKWMKKKSVYNLESVGAFKKHKAATHSNIDYFFDIFDELY